MKLESLFRITRYADTYMSASEFWKMFDRRAYDRCRREYGAEGVFLNVHDKVKRSARY